MTQDEMVGWYPQLNGHEFEQTLGDGKGQGSLACCSPWGRKVRHDLATEQQQQCSSQQDTWFSPDHTKISYNESCLRKDGTYPGVPA